MTTKSGLFLLGALVILAGSTLAAEAVPTVGATSALRAQRVEEFGVRGFRRDYFGALTVTPFSADRTIAEGPGHSRVTRAGEGEPFDPAWVEEGVEFVAYRIHKNPVEATPEGFFPAVLGGRYARVVRVADDRNLIVNFEYNGGVPDAPRVSERASGYFFVDCAPALRKMVVAPDRPDVFLFESGRCYVIKGMPNIPFLAREQARDMRWRSTEPGKRARIKLSAEDAFARRARGATALPSGAFFSLDAHDRSLFLEDIDIIGPTYAVPVVEEAWDGVMFAFLNGPCARTLEIRNCNTFAEKEEVERDARALPPGATWVAPAVTGIVGGGGRRGDRGDGVVDIVGYQRFNLIRSTWIARGIHSIKNNDGAGNWITIDGVDTAADGSPVHRVYEAMYVKRNRFENVRVSFHNFEGAGARRGVRAESPDFSWLMLTNQYWTGGTSTSSAEPTVLDVDTFRLYFGNNGDWRREAGRPDGSGGYLNAAEATLFDRIPLPGDRIPLERAAEGAWRAWGWGVQVGDVLTIAGRDAEVAARKRRSTTEPLFGIGMPARTSGYAHYWELTFKGDLVPEGDRVEAVVKTSRTAYLLDGKPRAVTLIYDRDLHGHWQYNRAEVNYEFRNIFFNGYYRQTAGPAANTPDYQGLWEFPVTQEWVNCVARESDGSVLGKPAWQIGSEAFNKNVLQRRNAHPDSRRRDHHILVDGGRLFAQRLNPGMSPVQFRNRPTLIYGTASFGEPRLCNPVLLDDRGLDCPAGLAVALVGGHRVNLGGSVIGRSGAAPVGLQLYGNGTVILDGLQVREGTSNKQTVSGAITTTLANGLARDRFNLHIQGVGGTGGFRLEGTPEDGSVRLTDWNLRTPIFTRSPFNVSPGWQALPGFAEKVVVNGKPGGVSTP